MMTATMTVRAKRNRIGDLIRAFVGKRFNVVNFQIRQTKLLKRSGFATAIAMTFGFVAHLGPDLGITHIDRARVCCSLRFLNAFWRFLYLLLLKQGSATF